MAHVDDIMDTDNEEKEEASLIELCHALRSTTAIGAGPSSFYIVATGFRKKSQQCGAVSIET